MKVQTNVKAGIGGLGGTTFNRCESFGLRAITVKTGVKAGSGFGGTTFNRCESFRLS